MEQSLSRRDLDPDPLAQFERWFADARGAGITEPEAAALATATPEARPSVRMVLVKRFDAGGFLFFTSYASRKGLELAANPCAALLFHWPALGRQVRVEGRVSRVEREETAAYVVTRPRASRLSALASPQSRPVPDRAWLEGRVAELDARYGQELPLPEDWGGLRLTPEGYEFWQKRSDRLHDRFAYRPGELRPERLGP